MVIWGRSSWGRRFYDKEAKPLYLRRPDKRVDYCQGVVYTLCSPHRSAIIIFRVCGSKIGWPISLSCFLFHFNFTGHKGVLAQQ